jgi:hypothetical protein
MTRLLGVVGSAVIVLASRCGGRAAGAAGEPVAYCHRTNAEHNPYVLHSTDVESIIKEGHGSHTGPIFPATGPDGKWGDIVPPFDYSGGHFPGLNWTPEGESVLAANCEVDIGPLPPEPTTTTSSSRSCSLSPAHSWALPAHGGAAGADQTVCARNPRYAGLRAHAVASVS